MKRKIVAIAVSLCMVVAVCVGLCACNPTEQKAVSYVSMDINPSIEMTLDSHNKVLSVRGANEDGQVLLYGEADIVGLDVEKAVAKITELAVEYGYLDDGNKVVQTNVVADKGAEEILSKVNAKITATAQNLNMSVTCDGASAFSLARKLDNLKKAYPDNAAIQALTPAKLKLVVSASETGEISVEAAAELDTAELVEMVSNAHSQMKEYSTAAYNKAKTVAEDTFEKLKAEAVDSVYTTYFVAHHALESYYAFAYQGYKLSAVATNAVADVMFYAEQACGRPLNEQQIAAVSQALDLGDNVDILKNSQGEITVNSIEAYADKMFKNSELNAELEQLKERLTQALNEAESAIQAEIDKFNEKYQAELEQIRDTIKAAADSIQTFISGLLPDETKRQIESVVNNMTDIVNEIANIIADGKITADEVRNLANKLGDKSVAARKVADSILTDAERDEIARLQAKTEEKLANAKKQMDEAIAKAQADAQAYLQQLKDARTSK